MEQNIDVRPIIFVGINQTPYDVGDMIDVTLEDGSRYVGEITEIDMENSTLVMWNNPDYGEIVSFYIFQIKTVDTKLNFDGGTK